LNGLFVVLMMLTSLISYTLTQSLMRQLQRPRPVHHVPQSTLSFSDVGKSFHKSLLDNIFGRKVLLCLFGWGNGFQRNESDAFFRQSTRQHSNRVDLEIDGEEMVEAYGVSGKHMGQAIP